MNWKIFRKEIKEDNKRLNKFYDLAERLEIKRKGNLK